MHPTRNFTYLLLALILTVAVVEAVPIFIVWKNSGVWPLNNAEDFGVAYWAPLKAGHIPSFYFNQSGFYFGAILKPVHWFTDAVCGSKQVSLEHFQVYGYTTRIVFSLLTLGVVFRYIASKRDPLLIGLVLALYLALRLATPSILDIYHFRVGLQLTYVLLALVIALTTLNAIERFLQEQSPSPVRIISWGVLTGATFLEAPHYLPFLAPLWFVSIGHIRTFAGFLGHNARWALGAVGGCCLGLLLFYGRDTVSALAGVVSMYRGMVGGFDQGQPGFEQFTKMIFDPRSDYFFVHFVLAEHLVVAASFMAAILITWRRISARVRYTALAVIGSFIMVWLAHLHVWRTHGSYTTVFSLVYFGMLTCAFAVQLLRRIGRELGPQRRMLVPTAVAVALLGLLVPTATTLAKTNFQHLSDYQLDSGSSFRSFNEALERLPKPLGLAFNFDLTASAMIAHCNLAGYLHHTGGGWHGEDGRYSTLIQQVRFPGYKLFYRERATGVWFDPKTFRLGFEISPTQPASIPAAVLVPMPLALGITHAPAVEKSTSFFLIDSVPAGRDLREFLLAHPGRGVRWQGRGSVWFIAPVDQPELREALLQNVWVSAVHDASRAAYLISSPSGFLLLSLQSQGPIEHPHSSTQ